MSGLVKSIDLKIEGYEDLPNIQSLISLVKPDWPISKLRFQLLNEGISNVLFVVFLEKPLTPDNCVLVRIFGYQTELYIDRDREACYLGILNQLEFVSKVFVKFTNGICYGYVPGSTFTCDLISKPKYFKMVAKKVAEFHTLPINALVEQHIGHGHSFDTGPCVINSTLKLIALISDHPTLLKVNGHSGHNLVTKTGLRNMFPTKEYLTNEVLFLRDLLSTAKSPVKFCHNDLLLGNILLSPKKDHVHLIDFEYCGYNHVCYEIANHFCEFAGVAFYDASRYPSRKIQLEWIETYLLEFKKHSNELMNPNVDAGEVEAWLEEIQNFALASHLHWGIWSIVQSQRSKVKFDYAKYALARLRQYKKMKSALSN